MTIAVFHVAAVRFTVDSPPAQVNDCTCSICRRYGALWAYYPVAQVTFAPDSGPTDTYVWKDRILAFHRCRACGVLTHWSPTDPDWPRMGVNARLMEPEVYNAAERLRDGQPEAAR